ncbi:MAG: type II secretion system F family protein [Acidimicrobiales bacterium]|nr:type II secretion system F family protein [Acidimicrobiales bacterium]
MSAVVIAALGAGIGVGLLLVVRGLQPHPAPLDRVTVHLDRPGVSIATLRSGELDEPELSGIQAALGAGGLALMRMVGMAERPKLTEALRVLDKSVERHAYEKLLAAGAGFALPVVASAALATNGTGPSPLVVAVIALVLAAGGFFYPDLPLAERVAARRQAFKHAFSAYLDLVTILLAGGAGIESALEGAAEAGDGWAFAEIRRSLRRARLTRRSPWESFAQLGDELGVNELSELAATVSLAGDHGARVKQSLIAKADALRTAQAADLEANAEARTEKMIVPVVVMILGLVLFIAFGAVDAISDGGASQFAPTTPTQEG